MLRKRDIDRGVEREELVNAKRKRDRQRERRRGISRCK